MNRRVHWDDVYTRTQPTEVSWYQPEPILSLQLLREAGAGPETRIIDVGGGDSTLADAVLAQSLGRITVLDISGAALARARARLGARAIEVAWIEGDVTRVELPPGAFDVWHDRAVFHFLTAPDDRAAYVAAAARAIRPGGRLLIATFAADGPTRCSGLPVERYDVEALARELGAAFALARGFPSLHHTPSGVEQRFTVAVFERIASD